MSSHLSARTDRLWLDLPTSADVDGLFAIHSDPASWTHLPSGRMTERRWAEEMVPTSARQFDTHGLGYWSARESEAGPVIGRVGCAVPEPERPWWNLYYRFAGSAQGKGYAREAASYAVAAAHEVDPSRPVLAYLLEHNVASRRLAERLGLVQVWRGPDAGNPDPGAVRLVFVDREPSTALTDAIEEFCRG